MSEEDQPPQMSMLPLLDRPPPAPDGPAGVPPDVTALFEDLTLKIIAMGLHHYSARAVLHRIRWHEHIERGNRAFKCNNNWTPALSRWFMAKHPRHEGFFETRASPGEDAE